MIHNILYIHIFIRAIAGSEYCLVELLKRLDRNKFNPIILVPSEGIFVNFLRKNGYKIKIMNLQRLNKRNPLPFLFTIFHLIIFLIKNKISLIHTNGAYANQYASVAAKLLGIPIICHIHTNYPTKVLRKSFIRLANVIIVPSNAIGKLLLGTIKQKEKIVTVYNGVNLDRFNIKSYSNKIREEYFLDDDTSIVAFIGQVIELKGIKYYI